MDTRLQFIDVRSETPKSTFCQEIDEGLSSAPKCLPTCYLYDRRGSDLFEEITKLPEYYPTRTERSILTKAASEIVEEVGNDISIVEFGSGSSIKTRLLLSAALERQLRLEYVPIDISTEFLKVTSESLLGLYPGLSIHAIGAEYFDAIGAIPDAEVPRLMLFLGSNIGNLSHPEAVEFLSLIRGRMRPHDRVLIGIDLVKERSIIESAYNDSKGVTAEFNLNLLLRINRELNGNFDLSRFYHSAPYDDVENRIEMRLYSGVRQRVDLDDIGRSYDFEGGEYIHTEWSHKYTRTSFAELCRPARLQIDSCWTDEREWFSLMLLRPDGV